MIEHAISHPAYNRDWDQGSPRRVTPIQITDPPFFGDETSYYVRKWQRQNKHILALLPSRWDGLSTIQKWVLLRMLAARGNYTPNWIDPGLWASLRKKLDISSFEIDTDLLEDDHRETVQ